MEAIRSTPRWRTLARASRAAVGRTCSRASRAPVGRTRSRASRAPVARAAASLAACASLLVLAAAQAPSKPAGEKIALRARWPERGAVRVDEVHTKNGADVEKRYVLRWAPAEAGGASVLEFTDFELVRYHGLAPEEPGVAAALALVEPLLRAMPRWRIGRAGAFEGLVEFEAGIERMIAKGRADGTFDADAEKLLRTTFEPPEAKRRLEQYAGETWRLWGEVWNGVEIAVGEARESPSKVLVGRDEVTARVDARCVERLEHGGKDCVRLESLTTLEGEAYVRAAERLLAPHLDRDPTAPDRKVLKSARKQTMLAGIYEVATLLPHDVTAIVVDTFEVAGHPVQRQEEKRAYVFSWGTPIDAAVPPAPK